MDDSIATSFPLAAERFGKGRIAAIADAGQRRRIVVVLGMHRSGTSLCAHILSAMGIDMADDIGATRGNDKGHWERWEIVEFHDRVLELFNRGYFGPFHDFPLPVAWWADPRVRQIKGEIVAFLKQRMGEGDFGFKDPRAVRLMPLWHQIFNDLNLVPKIVLCLRNPAQVARSLNAREGIDIDIGEYRWLVHMADFFRYSGSFDVCTIEYEEWFTNPLANFESLRAFLDLQWQQSESDLGLVLSGIVDPALRHDSTDHTAATHPLVRSLYELASDAAAARGPRGQIDIVSQFVDFQRLQEPFQRAFERTADMAAKFPQLEQEAAALRSAVEERDAEIEAASSRASAAETRIAKILSEDEGLRTRLDEISRERDDTAAAREELQSRLIDRETEAAKFPQLEQEAAALRSAVEERDAEIEAASSRASAAETRIAKILSEDEGLRTRLDEISRERDDTAAAREELQSRLIDRETALRDALSRADEFIALLKSAEGEHAASLAEFEAQKVCLAALTDERDALNATTAELQSGIETLRAAITEAEQREAKQHNDLSSLREELNSLRIKLGAAERLGREHEAAAAARQEEISSLRTELDAARDVGKAALASLQITPAPISPPQRNEGWLRVMLRRFGGPLQPSPLSPG